MSLRTIDLCHWKLVLHHMDICKFITMIDLHCSFMAVGHLHRPYMFVVNASVLVLGGAILCNIICCAF